LFVPLRRGGEDYGQKLGGAFGDLKSQTGTHLYFLFSEVFKNMFSQTHIPNEFLLVQNIPENSFLPAFLFLDYVSGLSVS